MRNEGLEQLLKRGPFQYIRREKCFGMDESGRWLKRAGEDLKDSAFNLEGKRFRTAVFLAQQAAEKALKAAILHKKNKFERVHDLVKLAKDAGAPDSIVSNAAVLSPFYLQIRYPDAEFEEAEPSATATADLYKRAEGILAWARAEISK